ncbi:GntR family transcriptional regulator [Paracoccus aminophilus]|uniref:Transcriptional regulator, GntR family n=1 Tax=Paracoccus aminophilus JCM 7686 TaxID=1367847 RepID=S5XZD7_PARAH|nr:GntR family transcriptional regulator [Paracoccus aminophilus]AGT10652.1 transcriptional regulator, GntR family [Paracoccus aminophilus JCM 7686]
MTEKPGDGSLTGGVREELTRLILSGEFQPGDRLNELSLTQRLGVSRGIIREAVRSLEHARLVEIIPNRGVVVRTVDVPDALELYEVRAALAMAAGRLAAIRASKEQLDALSALHAKMVAATEANDIPSYTAANHAFHDAIFTAASNSRLKEHDLSVRNEMQLYIRRGALGHAQLKASNLEHGRILAALIASDSEGAAREFEQHIANGKQRMLENLRSAQALRAG